MKKKNGGVVDVKEWTIDDECTALVEEKPNAGGEVVYITEEDEHQDRNHWAVRKDYPV